MERKGNIEKRRQVRDIGVYLFRHCDYIGSIQEAQEIYREYQEKVGLVYGGHYLPDEISVVNAILQDYNLDGPDVFVVDFRGLVE